MNASNESHCEEQPALVPAQLDKQAGEDLWHVHKAGRGVWSEKMLRTLVRGVKGGKWFSLIDKVYTDRTLSLAWEKVKPNAGACGVDCISIGHFDKDSEEIHSCVAGLATSNKPIVGSIMNSMVGYECACVRSTESDIENVVEVEESTITTGPIGTLPSLDCLA